MKGVSDCNAEDEVSELIRMLILSCNQEDKDVIGIAKGAIPKRKAPLQGAAIGRAHRSECGSST